MQQSDSLIIAIACYSHTRSPQRPRRMLPPWPPPTLLIHSSSILHHSSSSDIILHPSFILSILFLFILFFLFSFIPSPSCLLLLLPLECCIFSCVQRVLNVLLPKAKASYDKQLLCPSLHQPFTRSRRHTYTSFCTNWLLHKIGCRNMQKSVCT